MRTVIGGSIYTTVCVRGLHYVDGAANKLGIGDGKNSEGRFKMDFGSVFNVIDGLLYALCLYLYSILSIEVMHGV